MTQEPSPGATDLLLRSKAGRLFLVSAAVKVVVALTRLAVPPPRLLEIVSSLATVGLIISLVYFSWRLFSLMKRRLLWRVRRRLILSYIFIGAIPALLIFTFFALAANFVSMNMSGYFFKSAYDGIVADVALTAKSAAAQVAERPDRAPDVLRRSQAAVGQRYRNLSLALMRRGEPPMTAGPWEHQSPPRVLPSWVPPDGFDGTAAVLGDEPNELQLVIRSVHRVGEDAWVVADLPVDDFMLGALREGTGVRAEQPRFDAAESEKPAALQEVVSEKAVIGNEAVLFRKSVAFLDTRLWTSGAEKSAALSLTYEVGDLWDRVSRVQSRQAQLGGLAVANLLLMGLAIVAALFLVIQGVALLMGMTLARSITSSIHELFTGTERVQQGDFTHRIKVQTKDQLGELAESFNQMTGSIEGLLQTAAEKKRMEEELRIARQIQMSLLPRGPLDMHGLGVTALCVPAREVGGDYYDFFHLSGERLGILIADVAGKGTSAALYMAELKGLMLALSETHESPRALLIEVNRIISENLDARSFITMTYAVIDRRRGTMTYCRAGHTPLIYKPGPGAGDRTAQTLTPDGMVVGLRIPGAAEKFSELLEEWKLDLAIGDVVVFYTDGISEAMNGDNDLFGEGRLSRIIEEHGHLSSGELRERILREIEAFVGAADQHDDMTMILLKVEGAYEPALA